MGLSEREYMRTPDEPGLSNFAWGLIGIVGVLIAIIFIRARSQPAFDFSGINQQVEEQMIQTDPSYNRHERLSKIAPVDINSAPYEELRLLPRVTDAIADGIVNSRPFDSIEALDDVYGIGPKTIELIRPHIAIKSIGRLDLTEDNGG